jgi:hypothetical protein
MQPQADWLRKINDEWVPHGTIDGKPTALAQPPGAPDLEMAIESTQVAMDFARPASGTGAADGLPPWADPPATAAAAVVWSPVAVAGHDAGTAKGQEPNTLQGLHSPGGTATLPVPTPVVLPAPVAPRRAPSYRGKHWHRWPGQVLAYRAMRAATQAIAARWEALPPPQRPSLQEPAYAQAWAAAENAYASRSVWAVAAAVENWLQVAGPWLAGA